MDVNEYERHVDTKEPRFVDVQHFTVIGWSSTFEQWA